MSAEAHLSFHGATREVTGSCFLFQACGKKVLIDCGLYQGGSRLPEANELPFAFNPAEIDCLLLTHAHLDHCGRIPLLVTRGLTGKIFTTDQHATWRESFCSIPRTCSRKRPNARYASTDAPATGASNRSTT